MTYCKTCHFPIHDDCHHPDCQTAHLRGFCSVPCMRAWEEIKLYEIERALRA
jgi:hypothetical protein